MDDLKYAELVAWMSEPNRARIRFINSIVEQPATAFAINWSRVILLAIYPPGAVYGEKLNQFAHDLVVFERTKQLGAAVDPGVITGQDMVAALDKVQVT